MYKNIPVIYIVALWIKKPQNIIAKSTSKKATQGVFSNHKLKKQGSKLNILWLSLRSLQHKLTLKKKMYTLGSQLYITIRFNNNLRVNFDR